MQIDKMLTISTAHIPKHTAEALGGLSDHLEAKLHEDVMYTPWCDYGWVFWASQETGMFEDEHPELAAVLRFAHNYGCDFVRLDCDANPIEALPTFDW